MKLKSLELTNFRSYKGTVKISFDSLTVFVGKNDIGKSTILEALDIFFHDGKGTIKIDKGDINVEVANEGNAICDIVAEFDDLPDKVIIDSSFSTSLADEYLLTEEGTLKVVKRYTGSGTIKTFIRALHPTNPNCSDLLIKKNSDLKKIVNAKHIECENMSVNACLRKAIWSSFSDSLERQVIDIAVDKEDAKNIWNNLCNYLPVYSLFQSDRKNNDNDSEVQDPLKSAVKQILRDEAIEATLKDIASVVEKKLKEVSERTLEKLKEMDPEVANSLNPAIPPVASLKWEDVFKGVSITGDQNIPINKRGSGVKRLVLLNFFRAEAERSVEVAGNHGIIYAIEEPETSQHAKNQRVLIDALKRLSNAQGTQVILTTHSSNMVKKLQYDNLRLIRNNDNGQKEVIKVKPGLLNYPSLNEVNYIAFGEITEEYHNELYGELLFQGWFDDYQLGKPTRKYIRDIKGKLKEEQKTLTEYIRHQIHHPENRNNVRFTLEELKASIDLMRDYIEKHRNDLGGLS